MRYDFNPFTKPFDEINSEDLAVLQNVPEGWYVEYKREVPNASSIAKSVTAFANTYGGWLFYGIEELSKENSVAGSYPGITLSDADAALQRVRQAVTSHAQPQPFFRTKILFGPVPSLGLQEDRCIILIQVPWGPAAPFIHKSGMIYRRVGDGSEPRPENDRYALDQLWKRSDAVTDKYRGWIEEDLETSEAEEALPFMRIFIIRDFWGDHPPIKKLSLSKVRELLNAEGSYRVPFHHIYETTNEFICRQARTYNPETISLTWKLSRDLNTELIVPLNRYQIRNEAEAVHYFEGYAHFRQFLATCRKEGYVNPRIIDVNMLLLLMFGVCQSLVSLSDEVGWKNQFFAKIKITGLWRTIPFFDLKEFLDDFDQHGLPQLLRDKVVVHPGKTIETFIPLSFDSEHDELFLRGAGAAADLWFNIALAMGAPVLHGSTQERAEGFLDMGQRAVEVQHNRAQRSDEF